MRILLFLIFIFAHHNAIAGVQKYKLDEEKIIKAQISKGVQNRIKIEGDRIREVIGLSEGYLVESDKISGQIFIMPQNFEENPSSFTIITEKGKSQDIKITPRNKKESEIIIIEAKEEELKDEIITGSSHRRHEDIVFIMKKAHQDMREGRIQDSKANWVTLKDYPLDIRLGLDKKIGIFHLEIWEVKSKSLNNLSFHEKCFNTKENIAAIAIDKRELKAGEKTTLYRLSYGK